MSKPNLSVGTKAWADKINAAWRHSAAEIVNTGKLLLQAKEITERGDFENMVRTQLDFSPQTARKLMAVAGDQRIADRAHERALPDHWTTLYELTKLDDEQLDQAFSTGVIGPKMQRADVPKPRKESPQGDAVQASGDGDILPPIAVGDPPQTDAKGEDSAVTTEEAIRCWQEYRSEFDEAVYDEDEPSDVVSRFSAGLSMAMAASRELAAFDAAEQWPADMPLFSEELSQFADWMMDFEAAFRTRYGNGNDAALQHDAAE